MEAPLFRDIVIILTTAIIVVLLFHRLKFPSIVGFLITGILSGPSALSLVSAPSNVHVLSEIGVILLLFIIGLEFSLKSLAQIQKTVFLGGSSQVILTIILTTIALSITGLPVAERVFTGFLISLSSTAIGLKMLSEKNEISSPHGKISLAILIFQDIVVVPMMLVTPLLAGKSEHIIGELVVLLIKAIFIVVFVVIMSRIIVPRLLFIIAKTQNRETFLLSIVVICFSITWLTSSLGLSVALGAFLAGLTISESEYSYQATSTILPFREVFSSFFFISIGMLLDIKILYLNFFLIILLALVVLAGKALVGTGTGLILKYPQRTSVMAGLTIAQVGEFAFILSETGRSNGILSETIYQFFLSVSILTMSFSPFLFRFAPSIASWISAKTKASPGKIVKKEKPQQKDHLIIIGFGINGQNVARAAKFTGIPYVIVELNAAKVKKEKKKGEPIIYGDAVHPFLLNHINIAKARVAVIAISDPDATKRIIASIRQISKTVYIIVRTRFINEMNENFRLGANEVIPEEFETSIEIFTRVLQKYLVTDNQILELVEQIRADNYQMLRPPLLKINEKQIDLPGVEIHATLIQKNVSGITDIPLQDSLLRKEFCLSLVAIRRNGEIILDIDRHTHIYAGDIIYVFGKHQQILSLNKKIERT